MDSIQSWIQANFSKVRDEYFTLLRFKSISADPAFHPEAIRCAKWVEQKLHSLQFKTKLIPTPNLPLVYAEDLTAGPQAPTLLIYGHYDVQPVDPIELWEKDPFEPYEKNGKVYARGAQDDKGQIFYAIAAIQAMREMKRKIPVNLKFCIEGEEEFGSEGFRAVLPSLKEQLKADSLLVVDFGLPAPDTPAINLGARGIVTFEVVLTGSTGDLHSGDFGGIAYNPNRALVELLAKCWDEKKRIAIPHFYDEVEEMAANFSDALEQDERNKALDAGIKAFSAERGRSLAESNWTLPTFEINGIYGGYSGPGFKTVIPAKAVAKISCRLVPHQQPERVGRCVADFLKKHVEPGMSIDVAIHAGEKAYRGSADSALAKAAVLAYEEVFHKRCEKLFSGGSIPIIARVMETIEADVVGIGVGLSSDNIHAPNEHFGLDRFKQGLAVVIRLLEHYGKGL